MTSRSPRGSISGSHEVALDFADSLKDLQINNRYEISNLTIIAKENTEYAQAISKTLEDHIKTIAPPRKLPSLYVLDSIVKNVGTPYTVYLGKNLYSTFMGAYTLVDSGTRKAMEAMLKTWKEPVPGSLDPRPVFQVEETRPIENALIKARTAMLQSQQRQPGVLGQVPSPGLYRQTPTPPQYASRFAPPQYQQQNSTPQPFLQQQTTPQPQVHFPPQYRQPQYSVPFRQEGLSDLEQVKQDVQDLISRCTAEFARNPQDTGIRQRLQALLELQKYITGQQLAPQTLEAIKAQVTALSASIPRAQPLTQPIPPPQAPTPQWQPPTPVALPYQPPQPPQTHVRAPSVQPQPTTLPMSHNALAQLLSSVSNGNKPSTPQLHAALPAFQQQSFTQFPTPSLPSATPAQGPNALLDALKAAGLVKDQLTTPQPTASAPPPPMPAPSLLEQLQGLSTPGHSNASTPPVTNAQLRGGQKKTRIAMTQSALKSFVPDMVFTLYEAQPNQCGTCGRRFAATDAGRDQKARHLDWHFRINQRIADPVNRGQNRSWYVDEMEWIRLREYDPSEAAHNDDSVAAASNGPKRKEAKDMYVPVPTDPALANKRCPICQEEFVSSWHEEAQEWVWMDAVKIGGRVYHATCHQEVTGATLGMGMGNTGRERSATPDSLKRKADDDLEPRARLKREM